MNQSNPGDFRNPETGRESDVWVSPRPGPDLSGQRSQGSDDLEAT